MLNFQLADIKAACQKLNLSSNGMKDECLHRLQQKLNDMQVFNKVFTKLDGSSGNTSIHFLF